MRNYTVVILLFILASCAKDQITESPETPVDHFAGDNQELVLTEHTRNFHREEATLFLLTPDGNVISRDVAHIRLRDSSQFSMKTGLKNGIYRLLYLQYEENSNDEKYRVSEYGLGCRVEVKNSTTCVLDNQSSIGLSGSGTAENPYILSSYSHFATLRKNVNDYVTNKVFTKNTYFRQVCDINMDKACFDCSHQYGWIPIGNDSNTPFRGVYDGGGFAIKNLWIFRGDSPGTALFGNVTDCIIKNVTMVNAKIEGCFAVGTLVGAVVANTNSGNEAALSNCFLNSSTIKGTNDVSMAVGGLVGGVDVESKVILTGCNTDKGSIVSGGYAVGGMVGAGALSSITSLMECTNEASVSSQFSCAGGLVGSADTLIAQGVTNKADISGGGSHALKTGATLGTGGIAGGSGVAYFTACQNKGNISGYQGVGGIIGSTRVKGSGTKEDALVFNNVLARWCSNEGDVSGDAFVGGICGEAQFGSYGVLNKGLVSATNKESYAGGIAGNTSIAVIHNSMNIAAVTGNAYTSGILAKTTMGSIFANQNFGAVSGRGNYVAGVVGLAGNQTMINYCGNFAGIRNMAKGTTGGIVGQIGETRVWTGWDIADCVMGSLDIVMAFAGPVIAVSSKAVSHSVHELIHVAEFSAEKCLLLGEKVLWGYGVYELLESEERTAMKAEISKVSREIMQDCQNEIMQQRDKSYASVFLGSGLNKENISVHYKQNVQGLLNYYEASEENATSINEQINIKREERLEKIEAKEEAKDIAHSVIGGVTIVVSSVAAFASLVVTAGTSAFAAVAMVSATTAIVGGANAISKSIENFAENAVIVSQCVNFGGLEVSGGSNVGGVVGRLPQYGIVRDCANGGMIKAITSTSIKNTASIAGEVDSESEIYRNLSLANWPYDICNDTDAGLYIDKHDNYSLYPKYESEETTNPVKLDNLCYPSTFKKWNISAQAGSETLWLIPQQTTGYFPIPHQSEMQAKEGK